MVCGFSASGSLHICTEWPHCRCGGARTAPEHPIDIGARADLRIAEAVQRLHATIDLKCKRERMRDAERIGRAIEAKFRADVVRLRDSIEDVRQAMIDEMLAGKW